MLLFHWVGFSTNLTSVIASALILLQILFANSRPEFYLRQIDDDLVFAKLVGCLMGSDLVWRTFALVTLLKPDLCESLYWGVAGGTISSIYWTFVIAFFLIQAAPFQKAPISFTFCAASHHNTAYLVILIVVAGTGIVASASAFLVLWLRKSRSLHDEKHFHNSGLLFVYVLVWFPLLVFFWAARDNPANENALALTETLTTPLFGLFNVVAYSFTVPGVHGWSLAVSAWRSRSRRSLTVEEKLEKLEASFVSPVARLPCGLSCEEVNAMLQKLFRTHLPWSSQVDEMEQSELPRLNPDTRGATGTPRQVGDLYLDKDELTIYPDAVHEFGSYGKLFKATERSQPRRNLIVKVIAQTRVSREWIDAMLREVLLHTDVRGTPGLLELEHFSFDPLMTTFYLVFPMMDTLAEVLRHQTLSDDTRTRCCHQLAVGLWELHNKSIAHRDIKTANILVNRRIDTRNNSSLLTQVYLREFATCQDFAATDNESVRLNTVCGSAGYQAPELPQTNSRALSTGTTGVSVGTVTDPMRYATLAFAESTDELLDFPMADRSTLRECLDAVLDWIFARRDSAREHYSRRFVGFVDSKAGECFLPADHVIQAHDWIDSEDNRLCLNFQIDGTSPRVLAHFRFGSQAIGDGPLRHLTLRFTRVHEEKMVVQVPNGSTLEALRQKVFGSFADREMSTRLKKCFQGFYREEQDTEDPIRMGPPHKPLSPDDVVAPEDWTSESAPVRLHFQGRMPFSLMAADLYALGMTFWCIWYCGNRAGPDPDKAYSAEGPFDPWPAFIRHGCPPLFGRDGIDEIIKGLTRKEPTHRMDLEQVIILLESLLRRKPSPRFSSFRRSSSFQEQSQRRLLDAMPHTPFTD